ncbi:hypothetical protein HBI44_245090, partial [Parastagonospora nodorum]
YGCHHHKGIGGEAWSLKPQRSRSGRGVCQTCLEPGSRKEDSRPKPQLKHQHFGNETAQPRSSLCITHRAVFTGQRERDRRTQV